MTIVVGVRFKDTGKTYYFDPKGINIKSGEHVLVETSRGIEYAKVHYSNMEVEDDKIIKPLKKIIRIATEEDDKKHQENISKQSEAIKICQEKIIKHKLDMKLIDVEYTFDNTKVVFYFTAEGRIDFRELVKDLAAVFKMRIELRQVGVRDEAKMMGGVGNCGKGLCCNTWLSDFQPVSIKMAKVQNLSLNPTKISGICGRLMCCLKYENDTYIELKKGMPSYGERIKTPDGWGIVSDVNILESKVKTRLILENNDEDSDEDKLTPEYYTYKKSEIKRVNKNNDKKNDRNNNKNDIKNNNLKSDKNNLRQKEKNNSRQKDKNNIKNFEEDKNNK